MQRNPQQQPEQQKKQSKNKKGKLVYTLVYIEMNRIYIIIYRMWAHLAPSENCNKQTENRVQHTLRFLILQILLLWLYMYIIIL